MIILKTNNELKLMREANRIIAVILTEIAGKIKPGVTTFELDQWTEQRLASMNARPAFKGYGARNGRSGFPGSLCVAVNDEVVHGIPAKDKILEDGDIIGIDVGSIYKGYHGDGAYTYAVGEVSPAARALMKCCEEALYVGIAQARKGNRVSDISIAIERYVTPRGYGIVRDLTGHGIGKSLHEEPQVSNYNDGHKGQKLKENMTLAIEPMINGGTYKVRTLGDQWTVVTDDGSLSAHYEHTVLISADGPEILTRL